MRILHISDTHGLGWPVDVTGIDLIVHTGDMLPNSTRGNREVEPRFQAQWMLEHATEIHERWGAVPFIFITGNHDFLTGDEIETLLRVFRVDATCVNDRLLAMGSGLTFYGFPYVPYTDGTWNGNLRSAEMIDRCAEIKECTVLLAHSPMRGVLDRDAYGEAFGCVPLRRVVDTMRPRALLHGHAHESRGVAVHDGVLVSNAATIWNVVEI